MKYGLLAIVVLLLVIAGGSVFWGYLPQRAERQAEDKYRAEVRDSGEIYAFCAAHKEIQDVYDCVNKWKDPTPTPISPPPSAAKPEPKLSPAELQRILDDTEDECEKAGYGMTCLELEEQRELDAALAAEAYAH